MTLLYLYYSTEFQILSFDFVVIFYLNVQSTIINQENVIHE